MNGRELIGKQAEMLYAGSDRVRATGRVIAYTDQPTVVIEMPDGTRETWRADMTRVVPGADLPTDPTLGWATNAHITGSRLGIWYLDDGGRRLRLDGAGWGWRSDEVTAFVPATAVPTTALNDFRSGVGEWSHLDPSSIVGKFLAAVDEAGDRS